MIEGEFLTADDLGPLGRLVAPGELLVMDPQDVGLLRGEREWINARYLEADQRAEVMRKRLKRARLGARGAAVRSLFEDWTVEAAKLGLCDRFLLMLAGRLEKGERHAQNLSPAFRWGSLPQIVDVTRRVLAATDDEITCGQAFRAK